MKKQLLAAGLVTLSLLALTAKDKDPVLMNIAGKNVPLSEFEYLFHKNNTQQVKPQTIDEYVGMFVDYKLKVADAEAAGIDTTKAFIDEFIKFRNELSEPYMRDEAKLDSMVAQAYDNMTQEVFVSHIMAPVSAAQTLDSLRQVIVDGKATFEDVARQYSMDTPSAEKGGKMGYVISGRYPWAFEEAAFNTPVGEISPVVNSGYGLHLIRVEKKNANPGEVNVEHIIRLTDGKKNDEISQKALIDSLYGIIKADPSQFEELAKKFSQDGSAANGGSLGWFGRGMMVAEFDSVAFALPKGAISEPFKSAFGWHIIKKIDTRGVGSLEQNKEKILEAINRSDRAGKPEQTFLVKQRPKYDAQLVAETLSEVEAMAAAHNNMLDSALFSKLQASQLPAYTIRGKVTTVADVMKEASPRNLHGAKEIASFVRSRALYNMNNDVRELVRTDLMDDNEAYRNLVNEYRDGILLFEISNQNVWNRASKDTEGLEKFFKENRAKYTWDAPRYKSYVFFTKNDSVLAEAVKFAGTAPADMAPADFVKFMRDKFGREIRIERVIAAKGENAYIDYLAFGGPKPEDKNKTWTSYAAFNGKILEAPEEASDVRGLVVSDYQNALEKEWLQQLHKKYKVKINKKILKQVK